MKSYEDKHKKEVEKTASAVATQITSLEDKIKELEMEKGFISTSLAQARTDAEMQTKAR